MATAIGSDLLEALGALSGTVGDFRRRRGDPTWRETLLSTLYTTPRAVKTTLPWLIRAREGHDESLLRVALENRKRNAHGLALEMGDEQLTWGDFDERT